MQLPHNVIYVVQILHVCSGFVLLLILQRKDFLQLMIDAGTEAEEVDTEGHDQTTSKRPLTNGEIAAYCVTFLLAGYETTANTLTFTTYLLATNPEEQDKLCDEIDVYFQQHPVREHFQ